jgi:hypothetical protein
VLRFSCIGRSAGGSDFHPDRLCFSSHRPPPFPSPHLLWTKFGGHPSREGKGPTRVRNASDAKRRNNQKGTPQKQPVDKGAAEPEDPATVVRESASPGLSESPRPPQPATEKLPQFAVPVLRFPCSVGSVHGLDLGPGRFRCLSHLAPPFSSPHLMWVKFGGHPKKAGAAHDHATPRR